MGISATAIKSESAVPRSMLVAFSGADCTGKSTQIGLLRNFIHEHRGKTRYLWLRVGYTRNICWVKDQVRRLIGRDRLPHGASSQRDRFMSSGWKRRIWLYCSFADLLFETAIRVRCLRMSGCVVICDRYLDDSEIDLRLNFGEWAARMWTWRLVRWAAARPEVHIYLDLPFEEQLRRSIDKREPFPDSEEVRRLRARFYDAMKTGAKWTVLDTQSAVNDTSTAIRSLVQTGMR
jgi:thymidylate kinase